ncbi:MAG: hypothetical protein ACYTJ0_01290 [Planctomycetota bacterium]|jgi:hypothetical protein
MIDLPNLRRPWLASLVVAVAATSLPAQETEPPAETAPPSGEAAPPAETPPDAPPSLDELLGLDPDGQSDSAEEAAERAAEEELQQHLSESEVRDAFVAALQKMQLSADLLDQDFDAGLGTQRVQEEILRKLDQLIEYAKQQQQQQSSSSSSSSSSSQQQQQQQQQQPNQQPERSQQQQQSSTDRSQNPADSEAGDPPARQEGDINTVLEETRSEWGNLPPRLRKELLQGRDDRYSRLYQRLTEEYYRRLAEDGSP